MITKKDWETIKELACEPVTDSCLSCWGNYESYSREMTATELCEFILKIVGVKEHHENNKIIG